MNYLIADFIIRIKNAVLAGRKNVILPYSRVNKEIGQILIQTNYLKSMKEEIINDKKVLIAEIKYIDRKSVLTDVAIISKPSLRVHIKANEISTRKRKGMHVLVLSTNQGLMIGEKAMKKGIGGELLFEIW